MKLAGRLSRSQPTRPTCRTPSAVHSYRGSQASRPAFAITARLAAVRSASVPRSSYGKESSGSERTTTRGGRPGQPRVEQTSLDPVRPDEPRRPGQVDQEQPGPGVVPGPVRHVARSRHGEPNQHQRAVAVQQQLAVGPPAVPARPGEVEPAALPPGRRIHHPQHPAGDRDDPPSVGLHQVRLVGTRLVVVGDGVRGSGGILPPRDGGALRRHDAAEVAGTPPARPEAPWADDGGGSPRSPASASAHESYEISRSAAGGGTGAFGADAVGATALPVSRARASRPAAPAAAVTGLMSVLTLARPDWFPAASASAPARRRAPPGGMRQGRFRGRTGRRRGTRPAGRGRWCCGTR